MSHVSTFLHFRKQAEEAFKLYRSVFGGEIEGLKRFGETGMPDLSEEDKNLVAMVSLKILGGHTLYGNDAPEFLGELIKGNVTDICLEVDSLEEGERLHAGLAVGGKIEYPMGDMGGGQYFGAVVDKFGVQWMLKYTAKA